MDAPVAGCISDEALWRLASAEASDDERDLAHAHLDDCPICTAALLTIVRSSPGASPLDRATGPVAGAPDPATQLGRFVLRATLGSGSMGTVYTAWDPQLDREVAIKVLRAGRADDRDAARLVREARAMAQVRHPNVVTVYEVGQDCDVIFVAMERVTGPTLRAAVAAAPPAARVVGWLRQVAQGLAAVHAAGLTHRDIKPDNIFVEDDRAVVGDFGLATEATDPGPITAGAPHGAAMGTRRAGTPAYMAPELLRGDAVAADARTDIFAFGVTAWEMLHGARPYGGQTAAAIVRASAAGPPPVPPLAGVSPSVMRTLARCVHPDRGQRPPELRQVIAALTQVTGRGRGQRRRVAAAVGLGAVVAAGATFAVLARRSPPPPTAAVAPCDPTAPSTWDQAGPGWLARASTLPPVVRDRISQTMLDRRAAWATLGAATCRGDVFARTAWVDCRARVEHDERALLELAVARPWSEELALVPVFDLIDAPAVCASKEATEVAVAMARLTPAQRTAVVDGLGAIVSARALDVLGAADAAAQALTAAATAAGTADSPMLDAAVQLARAELAPPPVPRDHVAALQAAAAAAERTGQAALIADAWMALAARAVDLELDAPTVASAMAQAGWAIDRLDQPPRRRVPWLVLQAETTWTTGDHATARRQLAEAMALAGDDPFLAAQRRQALARFASLGGDDVAAAAAYRELLDDPDVMRVVPVLERIRLWALLAECQYRLEHLDEAARSIDRALTQGRAALSPDDPMQVTNEVIAASISYERGETAEALRSLATALATARRTLGAEHVVVAHILGRTGRIWCETGHPQECIPLARDALRIALARHGEQTELTVSFRTLLAQGLLATGDLAGSLPLFATAEAQARVVYGATHPMWAQVVVDYAAALTAAGRTAEARPMLERAVAALADGVGPASLTADARFELAKLVADRDPARAATLGAQALADASPERRDEIAAWVRRHRPRADRHGR
ncbi:MAG: serine/threonine-protein kinase [Kofleriaceae bacterium]